MENLPLAVYLLFVASLLITLFFFFRAAGRSTWVLAVLLAWMAVQAVVSLTGFYLITDVLPPRLVFLLLPPLVCIAVLFLTSKGRAWLDSLSIKYLTILHIIRIPVEIVLFCLFIQKTVPQLMTFEGRNFDILSGISAPFMYFFVFVKGVWSRKVLLIWNMICLALLGNIVFHAVLSVPTPMQQFGFNQPNIAILYFPFVLLPALLVPLVLLSHLVAIRQLLVGSLQELKTVS